MNMNVPINDDFEKEYKVEAWKGFDLREVAALGITAGIAAGTACCLRFIVGLSLATSFYIGLVPAAPFALLAFFRSRTGQSLPEHLETLRYRRATEKLAWQSMEYDRAWKTYRAAEQELQKIEEREAASREKEWTMEAAKLESMKKAYKKRIRRKHREEAGSRKKESCRIKSGDSSGGADVEENRADGMVPGTMAEQEISEERSGVPAIDTDAGSVPESGESTGTEGEDIGQKTDTGNISVFTGFGTETEDETRKRILMRIKEIQSLSDELAKSTREHEARIGKGGG